MKTSKKFLSVFLALIMIISIIPMSIITASAETTSGTCGTNLNWNYDVTTKTLTISGTGAMYDYDKYNRPSWDEHFFNMQKVIINKGVTTIGAYAFWSHPSLKSVEIPYGIITIGDGAFRCSPIIDLIIPDSVTTIGESAFLESALTGVVIFGDGLKIIENDAFKNSSLSSAKIPDSVTTIGSNAFFGCTKLTEVMIGNGCTCIGEKAFAGCDNLLSLTLGDNITTIEKGAFNSRNISEVRIENLFNWCNIFFADAYANPLKYADYLIVNGNSITSLNLPNNITEINDYAFYGYKNLREVKIDNDLTRIGNYAFAECDALLDVTIGGKDTVIDAYAFNNCDGLLNINICNGVTTIGEYAFYWCSNLLTVSINESVKTVGDNAFMRCGNISDVYYSGTEDEWNEISFGISNDYLLEATIHFNSIGSGSDKINCGEYGHSYEAFVTYPNYTEEGYTTYTCTVCGDSYISDYTSKTGLSFTEDIYSFKNGYNNFNTGYYTILDTHFKKLCNYVEANVGSYEEYRSIIGKLLEFKESKWSGSCYGMAVTVLLDKIGKISFNENFDSNAKTMCEVDNPSSRIEVMSAINYYHSAQYIPFINEYEVTYTQNSSDWSIGLKDIVEKAKSGKIFIFNYACRNLFSEYGHALVVTGYNKTEDGYILNTYDCRYPGEYVIINIDKNFKTCVITHIDNSGKKTEEKAGKAGYITDFSGLDKIDIDGSDNQIDYFNSSGTPKTFNTTIYFPASDGIIIQNENGDTLTYNDGVVSGTMKIISEKIIANSTASGEVDVATVMVQVADGERFEVVSNSENIDISFLTKKAFASATATNAEQVVFDENQGVYIYGENVDYDVSLTSNMNNTDMIAINGESTGDLSLVYENEAIIANGVDGNDCQVTIFSDLVNVEDKNFISGYDSVMITPKSDEYGDVDILASSNKDGNYDVSVMGSKEVTFNIQNPSRTEIRNKDGIILHANVDGTAPNGSYVKWESSNGNFDKSADGSNLKIVAKNKGWTTFTAILCDADGNELARDTVDMYSKSGFFDKIGGFFRGLFGLTKIYEN